MKKNPQSLSKLSLKKEIIANLDDQGKSKVRGGDIKVGGIGVPTPEEVDYIFYQSANTNCRIYVSAFTALSDRCDSVLP